MPDAPDPSPPPIIAYAQSQQRRRRIPVLIPQVPLGLSYLCFIAAICGSPFITFPLYMLLNLWRPKSDLAAIPVLAFPLVSFAITAVTLVVVGLTEHRKMPRVLRIIILINVFDLVPLFVIAT